MRCSIKEKRECGSVGVQDNVLDSESEFVRRVSQLSDCSWSCTSSVDLLSSTDLTLLHLAAAVGMAQLITALIKWR